MYYSPTKPSQHGSYFSAHYLPYIMFFYVLLHYVLRLENSAWKIKTVMQMNEGSAIAQGQLPLPASQME